MKIEEYLDKLKVELRDLANRGAPIEIVRVQNALVAGGEQIPGTTTGCIIAFGAGVAKLRELGLIVPIELPAQSPASEPPIAPGLVESPSVEHRSEP